MAKIYLNSWTSYCYRLKMLSQMSDTVWTRKLLCIYLCVHSWEDVNMSCLLRSKKCSNLYWKDSNNDNGKLWELQYWQHVAILGRLTSYQILYVHLKTSGIVKPLWPTTFKECHPVWHCAFWDVFDNGLHTTLTDQRILLCFVCIFGISIAWF